MYSYDPLETLTAGSGGVADNVLGGEVGRGCAEHGPEAPALRVQAAAALHTSFIECIASFYLLTRFQVAMWAEHLRPAVLDYAVWPRAAAAAERLWSRAEDTAVSHAAKGAACLGGRGGRLTPQCGLHLWRFLCEDVPWVGAARDQQDACRPLARLLTVQSAEAARPRLARFARQLQSRGLRPSGLDYGGLNWKVDLLPQWCDSVEEPQVDREGTDYCAPAATYAGLDLTQFDNLVEAE